MGRRPALLSCFFKSRANVPVRERPSGFAAGKAAKRQACCGSNKHIRRKQQGFNWIMRICCLCKLNRGLQNLESSRKETVLFFSLLRKEPKVAQRVATLWTPRDGSKLYRIFFSWHFRFSSLNRYIVRPTFSDVLNRCERVAVVQTQDRCFAKMGYCTASSQGQMYSKRAAARYFCCGENLFLWYADWKFWAK